MRNEQITVRSGENSVFTTGEKSQFYSSLWANCDKLRGGMNASQYKDYILTLLFVKYVSDKYKDTSYRTIAILKGASFEDLVTLKGNKNIGEKIDKLISKLAEANNLTGIIDNAHGKGDEGFLSEYLLDDEKIRVQRRLKMQRKLKPKKMKNNLSDLQKNLFFIFILTVIFTTGRYIKKNTSGIFIPPRLPSEGFLSKCLAESYITLSHFFVKCKIRGHKN